MSRSSSRGAPRSRARPAWRFVGGEWAPVQGVGPANAPPRLRVVSWNLLFELYDDELLRLDARLPALEAELVACDADVIALQEVTPATWARLLERPWARALYASDGPAGATLRPYGQALLSRWPLKDVQLRRFSRTKRVVSASLALRDEPLTVAAVHLTSDLNPEGAQRRQEQLGALLPTLERSPALLVGDFNFGDEAEEPLLADWVDAWRATRPGEPGWTYDPAANHTAALTTSLGTPSRLDRVLVRAPAWRPLRAHQVGIEPVKGAEPPLHPSDHFGVVVDLTRVPRRAREARPTHTTALALVPPEALWPAIQAVRRRHDPRFHRWMPHINLVYPFLPEDGLAWAEGALREALADVPPFTLTLDAVGRFDLRDRSLAWLHPSDTPEGALARLHARLRALFPGDDARPFTPHLTLGEDAGPGRRGVDRRLAGELEGALPLKFPVDDLVLLRRGGRDAPFHEVARIPLGTACPRPREATDLASTLARLGRVNSPQRRRLFEGLRDLVSRGVRRLTVEHLTVELDGLAALGFIGRSGAVDVAVVGVEAPVGVVEALGELRGADGRPMRLWAMTATEAAGRRARLAALQARLDACVEAGLALRAFLAWAEHRAPTLDTLEGLEQALALAEARTERDEALVMVLFSGLVERAPEHAPALREAAAQVAGVDGDWRPLFAVREG